MRCIKTILFILLLASQVESFGQVFPVQSTVQLTPPYSLYLSDYAAPGSERLRVTAFLIDATRPELNVRFRLRIEGNGIKIETKPEFMPPPVTLLGGVPLQLISSDLAAYFDPRNLNFTGITQREIEQRGALPEGLYQFCFEVIEYNRGVKISNTGCAVAWLILNDPPIVNVPSDNEKIRIQDPQQVIFQWTPRHRGTPNSAFNAEYDFKLVEVWPSTRNPNDAILTSPIIFQTTTSETTIIYGPAETPLEPGRRYAFQLRAHAYAGADELSLFKNNGYSQVYTFVYGDACLPPKNISVSDVGTTRFNVSWDGASNQTTYALRYRFANTGNWYTNQSLTPNVTVNSLQPNTRYEFQVNAGCGTFTSDYSSVTSVTTKDNPGIQYSCGIPLTPFNLDPSQLINSLKVGDVIKAGDFDVVLSKVSGSNGTFSGEGVIEVSYFNQAKVKAEFTNINVNNEMRMVNGYMNVTGAGVEVIPAGVMNLMDNLDEALAQADKALDEYEANLPQQFDENAAVTSTLITVPGTATVTPGSNGSVVIVDGSGKRTEVPAGTTASVVDSSGKGYIIDSKGKVHTTTAAIATAAAKREYNLKLKFAEAQDQKFGFDAKRYDPIASTYIKVEDQYLSWKSVATGQLDKVLATLEGTGIDKSKIRFELNGAVANSQWSSGSSPVTNDQSTIDIVGSGDGVESELIALYPGDKKDQVLGKLSVVTYDQIVIDLVIVPVNGNKYPYSEDALRAQLNKIFGQAVVKWNITFASNFDVPGIDPFDDGGSGLLSNYSPDMRKVVNAYKANLQPNTYYLFLVKNPKSSTLAGFMPRSKECGFIFVDKNGSEESIIRTMAHELGHGAFSLRHTFTEEKNTLPEKGTDNLMDYANGNKLFKYQWDRMRYPEIVMGLFEDDEDGAMVLIDCGSSGKSSQAASVIGLLKSCDSNIDKETAKLTDADMNKYFCAEERRDIIKCIANGSLVGSEDEQSIIRILKTTPLNQKERLVSLLETTPDMLGKLHSSIDGDELTQYYIELLNLYGLSKNNTFWATEKTRIDNIEKNNPKRTLKEWADSRVFFWLDNGLIDFITEGRIKYENEKINTANNLTFDFYNNVGLMPILTQSVKDVKLKPFETVRIYFFSDSEELSIGKGQKIDVPAIVLRLLIQKQFNREVWNSINTAFVFGTLGSGSLVTIWGKVDLFLGLGALLEDNYRADLRKTEEGRIVLEAWKYLNYALLARLGYQVTRGIPEAWKSLNAAIARLKAKNPALAQSVEAEAKQAFGEYVSAADDLVKGADDVLKSLTKVEDDLRKVIGKEHIYKIDSKGTVKGPIIGDPDKVDFTKLGPINKGDILTHNHPSGSTFSEADIFNLSATEMSELRAVTSNKIYSIKKVGDFNYIKWYDNYKNLIDEFKVKYADQIKRGMSFEEKVIMQEELFTKSFEGHNVQFTIRQ